MRNLLPLFLLSLASCGWLNADKGYPKQEATAPPPIDIVSIEVPGKVYYLPPALEVVSENPPSCSVEEVDLFIEPEKVERNFVGFVYDTVEFDRMAKIDRRLVRSSEYIHVKEVWIEVAAGDTFDFISWAKLKLGDELVAWGGPDGAPDRFSLRVDGSVELKQYVLNESEIRAHGQVRAHAPETDTYIQSRIKIIRFYDCE